MADMKLLFQRTDRYAPRLLGFPVLFYLWEPSRVNVSSLIRINYSLLRKTPQWDATVIE